ncbi:MAG: hypothetical protein K940chlam3_00608 [Chlamydiae bacterium]|nr:hypothetical protein [Chlamydiota bacterium]
MNVSMTSRMTPSDVSFPETPKLNFSEIAAMNVHDILPKINRKIVIKNLTEILDLDSDESHSKFQQLIGEFLIFLMPIHKEINHASEIYADEGYGHQGSRMAYYRPESLKRDFKKVLKDPEHNDFLLVTDEKSGEILGTISLLLCDNGLLELSNFYLAQELRREKDSDKIGLGKYLLSRMLCFSKEIGHNEVFLTSRRKGGFERALNLFTQFGFKEVTKPEEVNRLVRPEYQSSRTIPMVLTI